MIHTTTDDIVNVSALPGATLTDALANAGGGGGGLSPADRAKLDSIEAGATANSPDAALRARANHTGTQASSTIADLASATRSTTAAQLVAGANTTITQVGDTLVLASAAGAGSAVTSVAGRTGAVTLEKADVGLTNVDNTADADKPVSTATQTALNLKMTTTNPVVTAGTVQEDVYAVADAAGVALSPSNGSIQTWTLGASRTPTLGAWSSGQGVLLMIDDGTAFAVTWTSLPVTWLTSDGNSPALKTTGYTAIVLWKVGATIYGK